MITWHNHLETVRQFTEPVVEIQNRRSAPAEHGEVTCMNQQVALRYIQLAMQFVSVRYHHDGDGGMLRSSFFLCHITIYIAQASEGKIAVILSQETCGTA